jgi:uncharacterized protein (UPF0333 family)
LIAKKGQVTFVLLSLAVVVIILALAFAPVLKQFTDDARNSSSDSRVGLDCSNSSISTFDKANCMAVDVINPYFIGFLLLIAGAFFVAKVIGAGA